MNSLKGIYSLIIFSFFSYPLVVFAEVDDIDEIVDGLCKCNEDANSKLKIVVEKVKGGDVNGANKLLEEMQPQLAEVEKCTQELKEKFPPDAMSEESKKKAQEQVQKKCPTPSVEGLDQNPPK